MNKGMGMKITKDGFIWKLICFEEAKVIFSSGALQIYQLRDNDVEGLIENFEDLSECGERDIQIGIEVGKIEVEQAKEIITNSGRGLVTYSIYDFEGRSKDLIKDLEEDEEQETLDFDETKFPFALEKMCTNHDMCNGITWETIDFYLMEYCRK
jgi:hypothetical protein